MSTIIERAPTIVMMTAIITALLFVHHAWGVDNGRPRGGATLSAGDHHTCLLRKGRVYCWGRNDSGQLGDGTLIDSASPVETLWPVGVVKIEARADTTCALTKTGTLWCWGKIPDSRPRPVQIMDVSGAIDMVVGDGFACALDGGGTVRCVGNNSHGQLGFDLTWEDEDEEGPPCRERSVEADCRPLELAPSSGKITGIIAHQRGVCALVEKNAKRQIRCWGSSGQGVHSWARRASSLSELWPIESSFCRTFEDGLVRCKAGLTLDVYGSQFLREQGKFIRGVKQPEQLAFGDSFSCVRNRGEVRCWGGRIGVPAQRVAAGGDVVELAAGLDHACALRESGEIRCWGTDQFGQLGNGVVSQRDQAVKVASLESIRQLTCGSLHTCGLSQDGVVNCWGRNIEAQLGSTTGGIDAVPVEVPLLPAVKQIVAGGQQTCAVTGDDEVWCWGQPRLKSAENPVFSQVEIEGEPQGLLIARTFRGWSSICYLGSDSFPQCFNSGSGTKAREVRSGAKVKQFSVAGHGCGLREDGRVWCWGNNSSNGLGHKKSGQHPVPGPTKVAEVRTTSTMSCALEQSGVVWCWGERAGSEPYAPSKVVGLDDAVQIALGKKGCARRRAGGVVCWGENLEASPIKGISNAVDLDVGDGHGCAVEEGDVLCWGRFDSGQLGDGRHFMNNIATVEGLPW